MLKIRGEADFGEIENKRGVNVAGRGWSDSIRSDFNNAVQNPERIICLDLANIDFVSMFEWVSLLATIDKILISPFNNSFVVSFLENLPSHSLKPNIYIGLLKREPEYNKLDVSEQEFKDIDRLYRLTGFLESLRTYNILNRSEIGKKFEYQWIDYKSAQTRAFFSSEGNKKNQTTLLGLTYITSKNHCKSFLDTERIHSWREAMEDRFARSSLLQLDEVWRVIFHELAVNIWEHSGTSGFISSRIVLPYKNNSVKKIWKCVYPDIKTENWHIFNGGMLEICVADAGRGIVDTLKQAFTDNISATDDQIVNDIEVLSFAFDELGTCKSKENSWVTERHALGRILSIVSKYGGCLTIRSGTAEICYLTNGGLFEHLPFNKGYKPTHSRELLSRVEGTQIQILLPLFPKINFSQKRHRESILEIPLPNEYTTDNVHPRGHLVPLREALNVDKSKTFASVGAKETLYFKKNCEKVVRRLINSLPDSEAIVFDFSGVQWTAAQFETFIYCFQNIIHKRPSLIIELNSQLADEIKILESNDSDTTLSSILIEKTNKKSTANIYDDISEQKYLEITRSVNIPILALDEKGVRHIFSLPNRKYEDLLLYLIKSKNKKTIDELCRDQRWRHIVNRVELELLLHNINPLFVISHGGKWQSVWDNQKLSVEMNRVMSRHFDKVAERSRAWVGKAEREKLGNDRDVRFNLSWQKEWRIDFLESSKILSRGRYADEAAQRLIFRLKKGLTLIDKSLKNIHVLACPTGPAMLLATAIHKWWPEDEKPIVADMSYYALLDDSGQLPMLLEGEVVIVQDILDQGTISGELISAFQSLNIEVVCVIGLVRLVKEGGTRVTSISNGWTLTKEEKEEKRVPTHAMIETRGPATCEPPLVDDSNSYWIEPRALYPIRYPYLRREFAPGRDTDLDRRNKFLPNYFDSAVTGCLFASGHYVYGQRHYAVAVNVRKTLNGQLGDEIANWLADICLGNNSRQEVPWETEHGKSLTGSVTAVLMPLHSQIHYLWPKVSNILSQFGRRQPVWLLDATLFTGSGAAYRLPAQFISQIESTVKKIINDKKNSRPKTHSLRLLILDDAMTTGRTAETILGAISREVERCCEKYIELEEDTVVTNILPIEWIRYFTIFSQLGYARHLLWKNIKYLDGITFAAEEFAPFMGVPVYDAKNCPICRDRRRLERLISKCDRLGALHTSSWASNRLKESFPIAIDSPWKQGNEPEYTETGINLLGVKATKDNQKYASNIPHHTDTAIWMFYEYMYLSYPIGDFLIAIKNSWEESVPFPPMYRWSVLEWCLRNWSRVKASTAQEAFLGCALQELKNSTELLENILEASTQYFFDRTIKIFVNECIICFAKADKEYLSKKANDSTMMFLQRLEIGLHAFFLHIPKKALGATYTPKKDTELIGVIKDEIQKINTKGPSYLKNIYTRLIRPRRLAKPDWALNVIAEALLRGRNPNKTTGDSHHLLPGLIDRVLTSWRYMDWLLLQGSISLFKAALDDLSPYTTIDPSFEDKEGGKVKQLCVELIKWYDKFPKFEDAQKNSPRELEKLLDVLDVNGKFTEKIHRIFHPELNEIKCFLEDRKTEKDDNDLLHFEFTFNETTEHCRCLVLSNHLKMCLANITIDHIANCHNQHSSKIICSRTNSNTNRISFRILTNFTDHKQATSNLFVSSHFTGERNILQSFGVIFGAEWVCPSEIEIRDGYTAAFELSTPSGYMPRRQEL